MWCDFWAGGVIGPFFFEDDESVTVTVNGEGYRHMLTRSGLPGPATLPPVTSLCGVMSNLKCTLTNRVTIQQLKAEILRVIADVTPDIRERVIANFIERVNIRRLSGNGHMPDIVFHH